MFAARSSVQPPLVRITLKKQHHQVNSVAVRAAQNDVDDVQIRRRTALIAGQLSHLPTISTLSRLGGLFASTLAIPDTATADEFNFTILPEKLSAAQARQQREEVQERTERALAPVLTAADAPLAMRLVFNDAGTFDYTAETGGLDGSIVLDEELNRSENAMLKPLVAKLKDIKTTVDEKNAANGQGPISWADLLVLTARLAVSKEWRVQKRKRTASEEDAQLLQTAFGATWPVKIGRLDSNTPGPAGRIPPLDASVNDIKTFLLQLGAKPEGGFGYKPPFYERPGYVVYTAAQPDPDQAEAYLATDPEFAKWKENYDRSKRTLTRTNYEVDFITYFTRLTNLGAKFDSLAYLRPVVVASKRF